MNLICTVIIEKVGRKSLLLIGMVGLCIASFGIGFSRLFVSLFVFFSTSILIFGNAFKKSYLFYILIYY